MRPTRRKTVLGMGALATGSGAAFSSAAFQSSVNPAADMRVVVEDNLVVEAGDAFRDSNNQYLENPTNSKFYGTGTDGLFVGSENLNSINTDDLPAARVNDGQNSDLYIETAIKNRGGDGTPTIVNFDNLLQVENIGTEVAEVGISYQPTNDAYGEDVLDGPIAGDDVTDAYEFYSEGGSGGKISPEETYDAGPANTTTVEVGDTEQIGLRIDLTNISDNIAAAADLDGNDVFGGGDQDTVDILNQIRVGNVRSAGN